MDTFRVYLPSNASTNLYPDNTSSNYTTSFYQPLQLQGSWEVGVESVFYASEIASNKEDGFIKVSASDHNVTFTIQPRAFDTISSIVSHMNQLILNKLKKVIGEAYDTAKHKVVFEVKNHKTVLHLGSEITLTMSNNIRMLYGFINLEFKGSKPFISNESPLPLDSREQHLYIQSNIIAPIQYGNQKEYILSHFIHNKRSAHGSAEKVFEQIMFRPVIKHEISQITIKITNGLHDQIKPSDTKTLVTLIFRRVK